MIVSSSSSRSEWCIIEGGLVLEREFADGINPYLQTRKEISRSIRLQLSEIFFTKKIDEIFFYGAGCREEDKKNIVKASLTAQFRTPSFIYSDMLGAAQSLFKEQPGIACILSTGSNSCFYDGESIVSNVEPLGFILGDEGSGAVLGKLFLSDCLKGLADPAITEKFYTVYRVSAEDVLNLVYRKPMANIFLATLALFLKDNLNNEYVNELVKNNFRNFFERNLLQYEYQEYPISFVGYIAKTFAEVLREVAMEYSVDIHTIVESPMSGLVEYHSRHLLLDD